MQPAGLVTLTMRELDRLKVIEAVVDTGLKPGRAADRLGLSVRQVERLIIRSQEQGASGVASGRRGRPGNRKLDDGLALRALTVISSPAATAEGLSATSAPGRAWVN